MPYLFTTILLPYCHIYFHIAIPVIISITILPIITHITYILPYDFHIITICLPYVYHMFTILPIITYIAYILPYDVHIITILLPYYYHIITIFANIICMTYISMSGHAMVPAVSRGELRGGLLLRRHGGGRDCPSVGMGPETHPQW